VSKTARRWLAGGIPILVACTAAGLWLTRPATILVVPVKRQALTQTLVVSGRVMPPVRVNIGSVVAGRVAQRLVEEGRRVRSGEVLLRLDEAEAHATFDQGRAASRQAAARIEQLRSVLLPVASEALLQAKITLDGAERELKRLRALDESGIVTAVQLEDAKKAVEIARSQVQTTSVQQAGSGPSGAEDRAARAALDQARAAEALAETRLSQFLIRAPADGVIIARSVEAGDVVQAGQTLLVLAVDGPTWLTIDPDEKNLAAISMGQQALASADAYPGQTFPATVSFMGAAVDPQRGTLEVRLTVPSPPATLRPDMTVSVELQAGRRDEALVVPSDCVRDVTGRAPWVLALAGGRVERRAVRIGLRGDTLIEILSGVGDGELVIPASAGVPEPGTRLSGVRSGR
jgi:HlyD family secretion protein